jgi:hypothetical protein
LSFSFQETSLHLFYPHMTAYHGFRESDGIVINFFIRTKRLNDRERWGVNENETWQHYNQLNKRFLKSSQAHICLKHFSSLSDSRSACDVLSREPISMWSPMVNIFSQESIDK